MELPATDVPPDRLCLWVGLDATLRGDPDDPDVAWLAYPGGRVEVVWPPGYRARFAPRLEILDPRGRVVLREGQPHRSEVDTLTQQDRPHLLVHGELDHVVLGPFVAPGRTACLRCLDAHLADLDPRRPLVLEQQTDVTAPVPLDPVLWQLALAWAVRDVLRWVDGERPSTWSATVRLGPDPSPQRQEWLRHPRCGCGWAELAAHQCSGASLPSIERRCSREQVSQ